jgi:hypothetical protein
MGYSETQQTTRRYHLDTRFQSERAGNLSTKLTGKGDLSGVARWQTIEPGTSSPIVRWLFVAAAGKALRLPKKRGLMATRERRQIVETPTEARQAESGPSVLALLAVSVGLAILILGVVWFVFFRT